jgi:hypothetical protein
MLAERMMGRHAAQGMMGRHATQGVMGRQMMLHRGRCGGGRRRRGFLRGGVTSEGLR